MTENPAAQASGQTGQYAFDNARAGQIARLRALEAVLDPGTAHVLSATGVEAGWRCWEVGAGAGSVAGWLAERVARPGTGGPAGGAVWASDLDTTVLDRTARPGVRVVAGDLLTDPAPTADLDLVHARLVVSWLSDRATGLRRLLAAAKPGGHVVVEEFDFASAVPLGTPSTDTEVFARVLAAHLPLLERRHGYDAFYGRRIGAELTAAGAVDVRLDVRGSVWRGGEPGMHIWQLTFDQLRGELVAAGVPGADVDRAIELGDHPDFAFIGPLLVSATGRASS